MSVFQNGGDAHPEWAGPDKGVQANWGTALIALSAVAIITLVAWGADAALHHFTVQALIAKYN